MSRIDTFGSMPAAREPIRMMETTITPYNAAKAKPWRWIGVLGPESFLDECSLISPNTGIKPTRNA